MAAVYHEVTITTTAGGAATVYSGIVDGRILGIKYLPGASGLDTGADLVITTETTEQPVLTKANCGTSTVWFYPAHALNALADGTALLQADYVVAAHERIKVVVAQGGATKTGAIGFLVDRFPAV